MSVRDGTRLHGVMQYVAEVQGPFCRFTVLKSGDPKFYIFDPLHPDYGTSMCMSFPVRKADLRDDLRRALANGWGNVDPALTFRQQHERDLRAGKAMPSAKDAEAI